MTTPEDRLTVAVAAPLRPEHADLITAIEPRVELRYEPELLPPMRYPADFSGDPSFTRTSAQQRRFEALIDSAEALYGIPDVDPGALRRAASANPRLRWVHTMAAGGGGQVRAAGLDESALRRIAFTSSAGVHGTSLAEFALFGVLAGAKTLPRLAGLQRARTWPDRWVMGQVSAQRALLFGLGGIGREAARLLSAVGMEVVGVSRDRTRSVPGVTSIVTPDEAREAAQQVDAVVSALPGTDATAGMIGADLFAALRPGTTLVSVGRGTVIDEGAMLEAIEDGRIGFAALDVFAVEPLPEDSPLWDHERVLVSPHTAALTHEEERRIAELFASNATLLLGGGDLRNRIDPVEFY